MFFGATVDVTLLWGYTPLTKWAIDWTKAGNWTGSDFGYQRDTYEASITVKCNAATMEDLEDYMFSNLEQLNILCNAGETIFGAEVDITDYLPVTVTSFGEPKKSSYGKYTWDMTLRHVGAPTFISTVPSLSGLRLRSHVWDKNQTEYDVTKAFSYTQVPFYNQGGEHSGYFKAQFHQLHSEMAILRRYLLGTLRSNTITFPAISGLTYPFGKSQGAGPFNCKIIEWADLGRINYMDSGLELTFARIY